MKRISSLLFCSLIAVIAWGQQLNIKTNVLYDATSTINLGLEVGLGKRTSIDISGNYNPWTFSGEKQLQHFMVQPEFRLWSCERFNGQFFGLHALAGQYDLYKINLPFDLYPGIENFNYRGSFYGAGISYGYQWILSNHWSIEATVGLGYIYTKYDRYSDPSSDIVLSNSHKNYWGPTKVGVSFIYFIN